MFYVLSKILDVSLSPLGWSLALLGVSIATTGQRARLAAVGSALILYVFSIEPTANGLTRYLEHSATSTFHGTETYDAAILLGGMVDAATQAHAETAFNDNVERLLTTFDLLRTDRVRTVIITGALGDGSDLRSEARLLGRTLERWGIDPKRILLEERARNTHENALFSAKIAREQGLERLLVVTSAFHLPRATECFAAVGLRVDTLATDFRSFNPGVSKGLLPRAHHLDDSALVLREIAGRWIYRALGYGKATS